MKTNTKYLLAGSIIAASGSIYALQRNIDSDTMMSVIEKNKEKLDELISELIKLSLELLEKILNFLKKLFTELVFKFRMNFNI